MQVIEPVVEVEHAQSELEYDEEEKPLASRLTDQKSELSKKKKIKLNIKAGLF